MPVVLFLASLLVFIDTVVKGGKEKSPAPELIGKLAHVPFIPTPTPSY